MTFFLIVKGIVAIISSDHPGKTVNENVVFLKSISYKQVFISAKPQMKINRLKTQKHGYFIPTWSDKAFKRGLQL